MKKERAIELIKKQAVFPFWGNFRRFMTEAEKEEIANIVKASPRDCSFAGKIFAIANEGGKS